MSKEKSDCPKCDSGVMHATIIENAGFAVWENDMYEHTCDFGDEYDRQEYIEMARGAILAVREPSDAMVNAGVAALTQATWKFDKPTKECVRETWRAMVDELLKENG